MNKDEKLQHLLDKMHFIIVQVTQNLPTPDSEQGELIRKKMAVFTYGVAEALVGSESIDSKELYFTYLKHNGLSSHQAHVMVERTCFLHVKKDFGSSCMQAAEQAVNKLNEGHEQYYFNISELLFDA